MQKFYVNSNGVYLGSFDNSANQNAQNPYGSDAIEVNSAPLHANQTYDVQSGQWNDLPNDILFQSVRAERDRRLSECDWTQMPDAPLTEQEKASWSLYRQALRNVPQDFNHPDDVVWPQMP